jgi:hypothetical protein
MVLMPWIQMGREGRHVPELHAPDLATLAFRRDADQPRRSLQCQLGHGLLHGQQAHFQQNGGHGDGVAARHHRVLHLLQEDVTRIRLRMTGRHDAVAAMRGVATGCAQQQLAQAVLVGLD